MKSIKLHAILVLIAAIITISSLPTLASDIPRETIPDNTSQAAVDIAESYVSDTLLKVQNGMGYADAKGETNRILFKAYLANQTGGYSYGLLSIIANNAIFEYRDMYLRPDVYVAYESYVKVLLADLITEVETGVKTYKDAKKEAYTRIYKSVDPNYDPAERFMVDFCYWDVISVDGAMFNRARKVLADAEEKYKALQFWLFNNDFYIKYNENKLAQNWHTLADDTRKIICYNNIIKK